MSIQAQSIHLQAQQAHSEQSPQLRSAMKQYPVQPPMGYSQRSRTDSVQFAEKPQDSRTPSSAQSSVVQQGAVKDEPEESSSSSGFFSCFSCADDDEAEGQKAARKEGGDMRLDDMDAWKRRMDAEQMRLREAEDEDDDEDYAGAHSGFP